MLAQTNRLVKDYFSKGKRGEMGLCKVYKNWVHILALLPPSNKKHIFTTLDHFLLLNFSDKMQL